MSRLPQIADDQATPQQAELFAAVEQKGAVAKLNYHGRSVRYEKDCRAFFAKRLDAGETFPAKGFIADSQGFVNDKDFRLP